MAIITYEGPNGTETYTGDFETHNTADIMKGYVAIDSTGDDPEDDTLTLIPRSRIYSMEDIYYDPERDTPKLSGNRS